MPAYVQNAAANALKEKTMCNETRGINAVHLVAVVWLAQVRNQHFETTY